MDIILTEDMHNLGAAGDLIKVKDGYARNYLIPKGMAVMATTQKMKSLEHQKRQVQSKLNKKKREAEALAKRLEEVSCTVSKMVGEDDKLFGSVTSADIQKSLKNEGLDIDKRTILLSDPIKSLGIFTVPIKVHPEVTAQVKVWVVKD